MANSYSGSTCFTKKLGRNLQILHFAKKLWVQNDPATVLATTNIVQIKWGFNNGSAEQIWCTYPGTLFIGGDISHVLTSSSTFVHNLNQANICN